MKPGWRYGTAALALAVLAGALVAWTVTRRGLSARDEPSAAESLVARTMRTLAVPSEMRKRTNPVAPTPDVLAEGRAHFADHCAVCHGNDGSGQTAMGPNFYPKVPDMTQATTQSRSDGELFAVIENGIRLTGMPAWGDGSRESTHASWALVHFIRHLPRLGEQELEEMRSLNPKTRAEWEGEREAEDFLRGDGAGAPAPPAAHVHGRH